MPGVVSFKCWDLQQRSEFGTVKIVDPPGEAPATIHLRLLRGAGVLAGDRADRT